MSNAELPTSPVAGPVPTLTTHPDPDFERRWAAWRARGLAHEGIVRRRFIVIALMGAVVVSAGAAMRILFFS